MLLKVCCFLPTADLVFTSRRHRGYPFSLTFFLNQIQVLRLSACCEYKYGPGVLLGGRKGHFKFGRVDGGSPCYKYESVIWFRS